MVQLNYFKVLDQTDIFAKDKHHKKPQLKAMSFTQVCRKLMVCIIQRWLNVPFGGSCGMCYGHIQTAASLCAATETNVCIQSQSWLLFTCNHFFDLYRVQIWHPLMTAAAARTDCVHAVYSFSSENQWIPSCPFKYSLIVTVSLEPLASSGH